MRLTNIVSCCVIFLLIAQYINAQAGFRSGYIIKNNSDTLNGLVFYGMDGQFKRGCRFKRFEIIRDVTYGPSELVAFGFRNGRYFESRKTGKRKLFYECLIRGSVSLYMVPGRTGGQLYIDHASTGFVELNKGINRLSDGVSFKDFREFLFWLLDRPDIQSVSLNSLNYNAVSVARFIRESNSRSALPVQAYNRTPDINFLTDYSLTKAHSLWSIGLTGGYQFLNIDIFGNSVTRYFSEASYKKSYRPLAGVFINFKLSKKSDLASLDLSLLYLSDSYYGYAEYESLSDLRDELFFNFSAIQVPLSLKLSFGKRRLHPYIKTGVHKSFLINSSYYRYSERQFGPEIFTDWYSDFRMNDDLGFQGGLGIEFQLGNARRISFEAGYMQGYQALIYTEDVYYVPMNNKIKSRVISLMFRVNL